MSTRPEHTTDEHLTFLNDLRESGRCNMFSGAVFLANHFKCERSVADDSLAYWMETFAVGEES